VGKSVFYGFPNAYFLAGKIIKRGEVSHLFMGHHRKQGARGSLLAQKDVMVLERAVFESLLSSVVEKEVVRPQRDGPSRYAGMLDHARQRRQNRPSILNPLAFPRSGAMWTQ
jgi:hypothetical protein